MTQHVLNGIADACKQANVVTPPVVPVNAMHKAAVAAFLDESEVLDGGERGFGFDWSKSLFYYVAFQADSFAMSIYRSTQSLLATSAATPPC